MNKKTRAELELQLEKLQIIVTNIKLSHDRIIESQKWNNSDMALYLYNRERRQHNINVCIKANAFWHRKYHRELKTLNLHTTMDETTITKTQNHEL